MENVRTLNNIILELIDVKSKSLLHNNVRARSRQEEAGTITLKQCSMYIRPRWKHLMPRLSENMVMSFILD